MLDKVYKEKIFNEEMNNIIRKISEKNFDESVHNEILKFSKGVFENRYLLEAKKQKDKWSIKTSAEFSNYLVRKCLENESGKIKITGVAVSTFDLASEMKFPVENVKKYMGIQQAIINTEISPEEIIRLVNKYPRVHFGLSFKTNNSELKIKAKAPKSGKPGKKGDDEAPKADFCSLKTSDREIMKDLFFDLHDFSEVKIKHTIIIEKIEIPKGETNPIKMRENSIREGKVIRKIIVDERKSEKEYEFRA